MGATRYLVEQKHAYEMRAWTVTGDPNRSAYVRASAYDALLSEKVALAAENERLQATFRTMRDAADNAIIERDRLRSAIAGAREALAWAADMASADSMVQNAKASGHPENRSAHLFYRDKYLARAAQLRTLSSIGDLPAGGGGMSHHPRVIVCAAIKLKDRRVICGVRHFDVLMRGALPYDFDLAREALIGHEEGFVDNDYLYLDRNEAWKVAEAAGQIKRHGSVIEGCLHSEDLW